MKIKKCPFCEGEISSTAKKCKHCGERVKGKDSEKIGKKTKKHGNKLDSGSKANLGKTIKDFLSEYGILLIICLIILYFRLKPSDTQNSTILESNNQETVINSDVGQYELVGESKDIVTTKKGFTIFPNTPQECNIEGDEEIKNFADAVGEADEGETIDRVCPKQEESRNILILFNNSYSKDLNGEINKDGPNQRISMIGEFLNNKNFFGKTSLDFVFMFTVGSNENSKEADKNRYHFEMSESKYIKGGKGKPFYDDKRKTLIFRDINLNISGSGNIGSSKCNDNINNNFDCPDANSAYQKIIEIYSGNYNYEDKHTNNMFLKNLAIDKEWFTGREKAEIFIFTDGEFEIGYERENRYINKLKEKYKNQRGHDQGVDKDHNLAIFSMRNANRYQKDNKYESFWNEAIETLRGELPICEGVKINVIGLTRSAEFKPLAEKIYKQIFEPCEVVFK